MPNRARAASSRSLRREGPTSWSDLLISGRVPAGREVETREEVRLSGDRQIPGSFIGPERKVGRRPEGKSKSCYPLAATFDLVVCFCDRRHSGLVALAPREYRELWEETTW